MAAMTAAVMVVETAVETAVGMASKAMAAAATAEAMEAAKAVEMACLLYTSPSPRDRTRSRMPSSA